ncbi:hypothetical protein EJB05_05942, partial [Eragrostis curvula]
MEISFCICPPTCQNRVSQHDIKISLKYPKLMRKNNAYIFEIGRNYGDTNCSPNFYAQNNLWGHDDMSVPHVMSLTAKSITSLQGLTYYYNHKIGEVRDKNGVKRVDELLFMKYFVDESQHASLPEEQTQSNCVVPSGESITTNDCVTIISPDMEPRRQELSSKQIEAKRVRTRARQIYDTGAKER